MWGYKKRDLLILVGVLFIQLIICIPFLDAYPIELDEPFTIYYSSQPLNETVPFLLEGNNPPLFYILQHFWQSIFGVSPEAVRSFSLVVSLFLLSALYLFVVKRSNLFLALSVAGLLIFSDSFHHFSVEARMFQLFLLFSFMSLTELYKVAFEGKQQLIWLVLCMTLALYTHYLAVFVIGLLLLLSLMYARKIVHLGLLKIGLYGLLFIVLIGPILSVLLNRGGEFVSEGSWLTTPKPIDFVEELFKMFNTPFNFLLIVLVVVGLVILTAKSKLNKNPIWFFGLAGFGLFTAFFLFSIFVQPVFHERYLYVCYLFLLPLLLMFDRSAFKWNALVYLLPLLGIPLAVSINYRPDINRNTDELIQVVQEKLTAGYEVYYCPPHFDLLFTYYLLEDFQKHLPSEVNAELNNIGVFQDCGGDLVSKRLPKQILYIDFNLNYLYPDMEPFNQIQEKYYWIEEQAYLGGYMLKQYQLK